MREIAKQITDHLNTLPPGDTKSYMKFLNRLVKENTIQDFQGSKIIKYHFQTDFLINGRWITIRISFVN